MFFHTGREFEIYSIGDGLYMQRVLNGVAAMSNDGILLQLVAFGLLIGLLVMGVKNVMAGGMKLEIGTFLASFLLAVFLFGLRADVVVHDMSYVPGQKVQGDFTVANLPFGIAAIGSFVSTVGYTLTERMEQGYSIPAMAEMGMSRGGFGKILEWVNSIRLWEQPTAESPSSRDLSLFQRNLTAYIRECTLPAVDMGHICLESVRAAHDPLSMHTSDCTGGIGYGSHYRMVEFVTGFGGGGGSGGKETSTYTCNDGHQVLLNNAGTGEAGFYKALGSVFPETVAAQSAQSTFAAAYESIGVASGHVQGVVLANAVGASLDRAMRSYEHRLSLTTLSEVMIEQASQQRLVQWAAEETMFRRIMRPMMAFFESLMYALAPFMALAVGLGTFGIATVFRYMMLTVWVSLWMPVLSIIQLFQITSVQHVVRALYDPMTGSDAMNPTSIAGAHLLRSEALEWMATGAALAAWTPAITMALVFSGAITASALAGKMQGQDTINEKLTAPDHVNAPPAVQRGSMGEFTQGGGARMADASTPQVQWGQVIARREESSNQAQDQISESAIKTVSSMVSDSIGRMSSSEYSRGLNHSGGASHSSEGVVSTGQESGWGKSSDSQARASFQFYSQLQSTLTAGGNVGAGKGGASLSAGGRFDATQGQRADNAVSGSDAVRESESGSTSYRTGSSRRVFDQVESLVNQAVRDGVQGASEIRDVLQNAKQEMASSSATRGYTEAASIQASLGTSQSESIGQATERAIRMAGGSKEKAEEALAAAVAATGSQEAARLGKADAEVNWGMSGSRASIAGYIAALSGHYDSYGSVEGSGMASRETRAAHLMDAMDGNHGGGMLPTQGYFPPDGNKDVASSLPQSMEQAKGQIGSPVGPRSTRDSVQSATAGGGPGAGALSQTPGSVNGGEVNYGSAQQGGTKTNTIAEGEEAISSQNVESARVAADDMRERLARNPTAAARSSALSYPNNSEPMVFWARDAAPYADQYDGTKPYIKPSGGSEGNVGLYNETLAAVRNSIPGESDLVQRTVAAVAVSNGKSGLPESIRQELNNDLRNYSTESDVSRINEFTDERRGYMQQQLASAEHRAGELSDDHERRYGGNEGD